MKNLKILIVEDDPIIRFTMSKMLGKIFSTIVVAENGKHGLDLVAEEDFDVIVTDLQMPVMDGYEMIKELRNVGVKTPIIICSAFVFEETDKYQCSWLSKPILVDELIDLIDISA